jgi:hypothetical protein
MRLRFEEYLRLFFHIKFKDLGGIYVDHSTTRQQTKSHTTLALAQVEVSYGVKSHSKLKDWAHVGRI